MESATPFDISEPESSPAPGTLPRSDSQKIENVAVVVFGKDASGLQRFLLTERAWAVRGESVHRFDFPGGACDHKDLLTTAQNELWEETAKYPPFDPAITTEWLANAVAFCFERQSTRSPKVSRTLIVIADLAKHPGGESIEGLEGRIYDRWRERIADRENLKSRFTEKSGWRTVRSSVMRSYFEQHPGMCEVPLGGHDEVRLMDYAAESLTEMFRRKEFEFARKWFELSVAH